ncbi:sacsin N-terminal ATP-binding-like domain-containing protein [Haloterrigena salina]|nr:DUF3883 domain-containing protein [Haloterrigena salina]
MQQDPPRSIGEIQKRQLQGYCGHPNRIVVDANNERQDRAGYDGRFIFELLQNAADEMADSDEPAIHIELSEETLYVANNGRAFDYKDLYALTMIAETTKAGERTIGHKGRGFTSVLGVTDQPSVFSSEGVSAKFDREETRDLLLSEVEIESALENGLELDDIPILSIPTQIDTTPPEVETLLSNRYDTVFKLPLRDPDHHRVLIEERLRSLDENTIGLLPELEHVEIVCEEWNQVWHIERTGFGNPDDPGLVEITECRHLEEETLREQHRFLLFEGNEINRDEIVERASLEEKEVEAMGELSVTVGFRAVPRAEDPDGPTDWALAPVSSEDKEEPPYLHVFLPTHERNPMPALVSGTFQTDSSRRNLPLDYEPEVGYQRQFNALLFEEVAELIAESVVSFVNESATEPREFVAAMDPTFGGQLDPSYPVGSVEHCLLENVREKLSDRPFVPILEGSDLRPIEDIVLPHTSDQFANLGQQYADAIGQPSVSIDESQRWIPARSLLDHTTIRALNHLRADKIDVREIPHTIAESSGEPDLNEYRTTTKKENGQMERGTLLVDPVLRVLTKIRKTLEADEDREELDEACRSAAVFPSAIERDGDRYEVGNRIPTDEEPPFLPPREDVHSDALPGIQFLPRELYHGTNPDLGQSLRDEHVPELKPQLEATWEVRRYEFDSVFGSAISPHLPGPGSPDADPSQLQERDTLESIRELAAVGSGENGRSPDEPLLYESSRRPYQALARLRVPARPISNEEEIQWRPAHEVYFSAAWPTELYDDKRVHAELLLHKLSDHIGGFNPALLVEPAWFDLEGDEEPMRSWYDFFRWLGVAEHLRPLPFFPPNAQHQYKSTGSLSRPGGSAIDEDTPPRYSKLSEDEWQDYRDHLQKALDVPESDQYIHQINPLEYGEEIRDVLTSDEVPNRVQHLFLDHLADWWDGGFDRFRRPQLAEFTNDNWRGRSTNRYFKKGELREIGSNLWLWQLQRAAWLPTTHGKVEPRRAWHLEKNDESRFTIGETTLLPIVNYRDTDVRTVAPALEIGFNLEESFTPSDAVYVLRQVAEAYEKHGRGVEGAIEGIYGRVARHMGNRDEEPAWDLSEHDLRVLCHQGPGSYTLDPESGPYYARSHRERELYEKLGVPMLNLFKEHLSIRFGECIGATDVRDGNQMDPETGVVHEELSVDVDGFELTPEWIETVLAGFLLRLRIDRDPESEDLRRTQLFYQKLTFVEDLVLTPSGTVSDASAITSRNYYIERDTNDNRILIDRCSREDEFKKALAKAYTEYLDVSSHYEGVIRIVDTAFQKHEPTVAIIDDLAAVGSSASVPELQDVPIGEAPDESDGASEPKTGISEAEDKEKTDERPITETSDTSEPRQKTVRADRVPDPASIRRIGDGSVAAIDFGGSQSHRGSGGSGGSDRPPRVPTGDYREKIDSFGMETVQRWEAKRIEGDPEKCIWDVSVAEKYEDLLDKETESGPSRDTEPLREAIENFGEKLEDSRPNPLEAPWPGFDVLTLKCDNGQYEINRCIELKTTARKTYKPGISWNQWKAASGSLRDHYYLYVVRNVRKGKSGEAELLEVPHPFRTLDRKTTEQRTLQVQFDLRDFDSETSDIWQHAIEWGN